MVTKYPYSVEIVGKKYTILKVDENHLDVVHAKEKLTIKRGDDFEWEFTHSGMARDFYRLTIRDPEKKVEDYFSDISIWLGKRSNFLNKFSREEIRQMKGNNHK